MTQVDYSERAIDKRIRRVAQLRNLCLSLAKAGEAARMKEAETREEQPPAKR